MAHQIEEKEEQEHYEEYWVPIEGFPNYEVSNYGRIVNVKTDHELTLVFTQYKPTRVTLYRDGVSHKLYVHRLVAQAFFQNYRDDVEVRHINEANLHDNSVLNLTLGGQKPIR